MTETETGFCTAVSWDKISLRCLHLAYSLA